MHVSMPTVISRAKPPTLTVGALGMLVLIRLAGRTPDLSLPVHIRPGVVYGSSCVAVSNIAGSIHLETHGAHGMSLTVVVDVNGRALVVDGVGVFAEIVKSIRSETSTSSLQVRPLVASGSVVGAAAEIVRSGSSAAPTTYLLRLAAPRSLTRILGLILLVLFIRDRLCLSFPNLVGSNTAEGRPIALRPILSAPCTLHPGLLIPLVGLLFVLPFLLILILLVPAFAEAKVVVGTPRGRAGSLVPVIRATGGSRRGLSLPSSPSPSVLEGRLARECHSVADGARTTRAAREEAVQVVRGGSAMRHGPRGVMPTGGPASRMAGSAPPRSPSGSKRWITCGITIHTQRVEGTALATKSAYTKSMMKEPSIPPAAAGGMLLSSTPSSQIAASMISTSGDKKVADATAM